MRVIVLGAKGQLGTDIVQVLRSAGHDVLSFDRSSLNLNIDPLCDALEPLPDAEVVINCIAYVRVDDAEEAVVDVSRVNIAFPYALARYCERTNKTLIHISTDFVFNGEKGEPYEETDKLSPINFYGLSKAAGELAVSSTCRKHFVLRVAGLYGRVGSGSKGGNFVETILRLAKEESPLNVVDDQITSPTHSLDVARAVLSLINKRSSAFGTYHCTNKGMCSWFEFACAILEIAGIGAEISATKFEDLKLKALRPQFSALHTEKLDALYTMPDWRTALTEYLWIKGHLRSQ